jgi:hypothetical protein
MARKSVDERGFDVVRRARKAYTDLSLSAFKKIVREQFYMLLIDQEAALAAIPEMLPDDFGARRQALDLIAEVLEARGEYAPEDRERMQRVVALFGVERQPGKLRTVSIVSNNHMKKPAKGS